MIHCEGEGSSRGMEVFVVRCMGSDHGAPLLGREKGAFPGPVMGSPLPAPEDPSDPPSLQGLTHPGSGCGPVGSPLRWSFRGGPAQLSLLLLWQEERFPSKISMAIKTLSPSSLASNLSEMQ